MKQLSLIKPRRRTRGKSWGRPTSTFVGARKRRANLESFSSKHPLHITLRLREGLPNLRTRKGAQIVKNAIEGSQRSGIRVVHFSILSNHLHLFVECKDRQALYNSMKSFTARLGIHLRRWANKNTIGYFDKKGWGIFRGRYDVPVLKTAQEVKNGLKYVLLNPAKRFKKAPYIDKFSSAVLFQDWKRLLGQKLSRPPQTKTLSRRLNSFLSPPKLWLSRSGWMRAVY